MKTENGREITWKDIRDLKEIADKVAPDNLHLSCVIMEACHIFSDRLAKEQRGTNATN